MAEKLSELQTVNYGHLTIHGQQKRYFVNWPASRFE